MGLMISLICACPGMRDDEGSADSSVSAPLKGLQSASVPQFSSQSSPRLLSDVKVWTKAELDATRPSNLTHCFVAIFQGGCSQNGGVYQISDTWYNSHSGGSFASSGLDSCGKIVENLLDRSPSHS